MGWRERSLKLDGDERMLEFFRNDGWNYYADPGSDPVDMPSGLFDQMRWMADAGMIGIDVPLAPCRGTPSSPGGSREAHPGPPGAIGRQPAVPPAA